METAEESQKPAPQSNAETQQILLAAARHDIESLRIILETVPASAQDPVTLYTPLHAAIASCADSPGTEGEETLHFLLLNGAIWNDLDANGETPGCLALRLGLKSLYEVMVDAGVRAELLLSRLDAFQQLGESDDEDDQEDDEGLVGDVPPHKAPHGQAPTEEIAIVDGSSIPCEDDRSTLNENYLSSKLSLTSDRLLDSSANGVMMSWEADLMERSADLLLPTQGLKVLNIGFGMGIFDTFVQEKHEITAHHIVEAHSDVIASMKEKGWDSSDALKYNKKNVTIHPGSWQTVLPQLVEKNITFDAIYFDTFAEGYAEFREFFSEYVIALLEPHGLWSFFHGLGADRQVCYDVYTKVTEIDLLGAGFEVEWTELKAPQSDWHGVRRKYFSVDGYRLPICRFMG